MAGGGSEAGPSFVEAWEGETLMSAESSARSAACAGFGGEQQFSVPGSMMWALKVSRSTMAAMRRLIDPEIHKI
jgi:hypothetical protein